MPELSLIVLLSLTVYRATRFVTEDTLWEGTRQRLGDRILGTEPAVWRDKLYELLNCRYCLSVWMSAGAVAVADGFTSVPLPVFTWLAVAGGSMIVWKAAE